MFDILSSAVMLILLSPIFLIIIIAIKIDDPGPAFFVQQRNGLNGKIFKMFKFRSMYQNAPELHSGLGELNEMEGPVFKIKEDPRITRVGYFLRRSSIDELPQLLNILLGDMSVVGPRPLPDYESVNLSENHKQRMLVRPGLLCYWQVRGRTRIPFDEWMELDLKYINEADLWVDFKIILEGIPAVLTGDGAE
ncbi:MAG: sugar transferase [Anaerolineaceae bacterium]|nr:sugar transferase [Anaerolineaceae bacterium]